MRGLTRPLASWSLRVSAAEGSCGFALRRDARCCSVRWPEKLDPGKVRPGLCPLGPGKVWPGLCPLGPQPLLLGDGNLQTFQSSF